MSGNIYYCAFGLEYYFIKSGDTANVGNGFWRASLLTFCHFRIFVVKLSQVSPSAAAAAAVLCGATIVGMFLQNAPYKECLYSQHVSVRSSKNKQTTKMYMFGYC